MKQVVLFLIGLVIILMEVFFTNFISINLSINFLLVYMVFLALYIKKNEALIIGGFLGLLVDMISGGIVGLTPLLFLVITYFIVNIKKSIFKDKIEIICLLVWASSILFSIINAVIAAIYFNPAPVIVVLIKGIIIIPILNTITAGIGFIIFGDNLVKLREE